MENTQPNQTYKRAFTTLEAAHYCALSTSLLRQSRMEGPTARQLNAPTYTRLGSKKIVYLKEDLDAWLDSHRAKTGGAT